MDTGFASISTETPATLLLYWTKGHGTLETQGCNIMKIKLSTIPHPPVVASGNAYSSGTTRAPLLQATGAHFSLITVVRIKWCHPSFLHAGLETGSWSENLKSPICGACPAWWTHVKPKSRNDQRSCWLFTFVSLVLAVRSKTVVQKTFVDWLAGRSERLSNPQEEFWGFLSRPAEQMT